MIAADEVKMYLYNTGVRCFARLVFIVGCSGSFVLAKQVTNEWVLLTKQKSKIVFL